MAYEVPPLPYAYDALEPHIDEQTMKLHHDKHHQAYVDKANGALEGTELADKPVEEVIAQPLRRCPRTSSGPVRNNGGGHLNHSLFWESMSPDGGGEPDGDLGRGDRRRVRLLRRLQGAVRGRRRRPVRLRLGVARARRRRAEGDEHAQPGQPGERRPDAAAGQRRLGARLLPEVPEPPPRLPQGVVERRRLGEGRRALRRGVAEPPARRLRLLLLLAGGLAWSRAGPRGGQPRRRHRRRPRAARTSPTRRAPPRSSPPGARSGIDTVRIVARVADRQPGRGRARPARRLRRRRSRRPALRLGARWTAPCASCAPRACASSSP